MLLSMLVPQQPLLQDNPSIESPYYPENKPDNSTVLEDIVVASNKTENLSLLKIASPTTESLNVQNYHQDDLNNKLPKTNLIYQQRRLETVESIGETCRS